MSKPLPVLAACLSAMFCSAATQAQTLAPSSNPTSYVYVSSIPGTGEPSAIFGYSVAPNGALTALPNSPFNENESILAAKGSVLVGANDTIGSTNMDVFKIATDGSLNYASSTNCVQQGKFTCDYVYGFNFDNTGTDLYVRESYSGTGHSTNSFTVDQTSASLTYLGQVYSNDYSPNISFLGNNVLAFSASNDACMYAYVDEYRRQSNGLLTITNVQINGPVPPPHISGYEPEFAAADPTSNNVAIVEQPANPPGCAFPGFPTQIAVYTLGTNGSLNTTSTYQNMPSTAIVDPLDMKISPSGKILAVGGAEGLQLFHFNGANPVTAYSRLLTTVEIDELFWDNSNHLFAISHGTSQLFVLNVTPTSITSAPGSPYSISYPQGLAVLPLTQ